MTTVPGVGRLSGELVDLITERVVTADGAAGRADVILELVNCVQEAVSRRLEPVGDADEEASMAAIRLAAQQHRMRMRWRGRP